MSFHLKTFPNIDYSFRPVAARGCFIKTSDGKEYMDLTAGGTSFNLLGSNSNIVEGSILERLRTFAHLDCKSFYDENRELLSQLLLEASGDPTLVDSHKVFFASGSGAEAMEMAIHLSYQYHYLGGHRNKKWIISRKQSYHGATSGALSIGSRPNLEFYRPLHSSYRDFVSECDFANNAYPEETEEQYTDRLIDELEATIEKLGADNIAAFAGETILGGLVGDVPATKDYWKRVRGITAKHNIHLILDEVWCGTGVSGKYHCFEYDGIKPDFCVLGKTLGCGFIPISAVMVPIELEKRIVETTGRVEMSSTFQAHSLAVASALAVQRHITQDGFIESVYKKGEYIRKRLSHEIGDSEFVRDIRGRGVRNTVAYKCNNVNHFSQKVGELLLEKYNIIISSKWHRTSFSHAMNLEWTEIDMYLERYISVFKNLQARWGKAAGYDSDDLRPHF